VNIYTNRIVHWVFIVKDLELYEIEYKGKFLRPCPGTKNYICCGYWVLSTGENCIYGCKYCILNSYFKHHGILIYKNFFRELPNILNELDQDRGRIYRIGTGEFTDSLALDHRYAWSIHLCEEFAQRDHLLIELKTKSVNINNLLRLKFRKNIVVSWSLNSKDVWEWEEKGTPDMEKRIEAARICQKEGYVIGFHFDPIFEYPGWQEGYLKTIELMKERLNPKGVIWVSLGAIRFMPGLIEDMRKRGEKSLVLLGDYTLGLDGKLRLFKPIRIGLYKFIAEELKSWYKDIGLYLCMESEDVWKYSLGWSPRDSNGLASYLDSRKRLFFG